MKDALQVKMNNFYIVGSVILLLGGHFTYTRYGHILKGYLRFLTGKYTSELPVINGTSRSMTLTYERNGVKYRLTVPFARSIISEMMGKRVYLVTNNEKIEITQQPGVPYLVTAQDIAGLGSKIIVEDIENEVISDVDKNKSIFWV